MKKLRSASELIANSPQSFCPAIRHDKAGRPIPRQSKAAGSGEVPCGQVVRPASAPCPEPVADDAGVLLAIGRRFSRYCLGAVTARAGAGPRGSSRSSMHFLRKASRPSACSRCWSAPNLQVAIFCFASTAKHGPAGKSTIRAAARNAQRDMLNPPCL